jgi:hypothetical protein
LIREVFDDIVLGCGHEKVKEIFIPTGDFGYQEPTENWGHFCCNENDSQSFVTEPMTADLSSTATINMSANMSICLLTVHEVGQWDVVHVVTAFYDHGVKRLSSAAADRVARTRHLHHLNKLSGLPNTATALEPNDPYRKGQFVIFARLALSLVYAAFGIQWQTQMLTAMRKGRQR